MVIIYLRDVLDNKVHVIKDLEKLNLPTIGEIPLNEEGAEIVATKHTNTGIAEAFRLIRTNINFLLDPNKKGGKIIFVTSTVASEGKTFTSINLEHSIAHSGKKKTVVIGLDLRAPKLKQYIGIAQTTSVSNYIVKTDLVLKDIIIQ